MTGKPSSVQSDQSSGSRSPWPCSMAVLRTLHMCELFDNNTKYWVTPSSRRDLDPWVEGIVRSGSEVLVGLGELNLSEDGLLPRVDTMEAKQTLTPFQVPPNRVTFQVGQTKRNSGGPVHGQRPIAAFTASEGPSFGIVVKAVTAIGQMSRDWSFLLIAVNQTSAFMPCRWTY